VLSAFGDRRVMVGVEEAEGDLVQPQALGGLGEGDEEEEGAVGGVVSMSNERCRGEGCEAPETRGVCWRTVCLLDPYFFDFKRATRRRWLWVCLTCDLLHR